MQTPEPAAACTCEWPGPVLDVDCPLHGAVAAVPRDVMVGIAVLRDADPSFAEVADTLLDLAADDAVSPAVYDRVCLAVFTVLEAWATANMAATNILKLCDDLYTSPGPPAEIQRKIREAGAAPEWATR